MNSDYKNPKECTPMIDNTVYSAMKYVKIED